MSENIINLDEIVGELEPKKVIILGRTFLANPDPSLGDLYDMWKAGQDAPASTDGAAAENALKTLTALFGDEQADEIFHLCGNARIGALLGALSAAYQGKAPASSSAPRSTGGRSRPTSAASTKSTSAKRASARKGSAGRSSRG